MEEMLETVVCGQKRGEESASEEMSDSDEYSADEGDEKYETDRQIGHPPEDDYKMSLQVDDLQTVEMDCASSPYSYAFRIDAFTRKMATQEDGFHNLGHGRYLRHETPMEVHIDNTPIDVHITEYLTEFYFRELWPLFPIIDRDAFYSQLQPERGPPPPNSILTAVYFAAASTISQIASHSEVHSTASSPALSPRSLPTLPPTLLDSLRSSLSTAIETLSTQILEPRITTLQSIVLRCLYDRSLSSEQRSVLISDTVRIAQYILLHRSIPNITSRDRSLRKHLWWTIFVLEVWTSARDLIPASIDLSEVDIPMPIESEEPNHQAHTALVALTRILLDTLQRVYSPSTKPEDVPREVSRLQEWAMVWYCNLPSELLVAENGVRSEMADFLLAGCHGVLLQMYGPFRDEEVVRNQIDRSRGIIVEALGRLGGNVGKFGIIAGVIGEVARRLAFR